MRRFIKIFASLVLLLGMCGCASTGTHVGRAAEMTVVKKSYRTFTLENGLTLIVKEGAKGTPSAVQIWVAGGSLTDPADKPGLAHFVEHMLFTGSLHVPPGRAEQYIESMGGRLSGHTGRDFSYMGATMPGPGWERALDILHDLMAYPSFNPEQLEKQRGVVLLETDQRRREPDNQLIDDLFGEAYALHAYKNAVLGTAYAVRGFTRGDAESYYTKTYVPSNMFVVVVGDVDTAQVKAMVEKTFGKMAPVKVKRPRPEPEPYQIYTRSNTNDAPVKLTYMAVAWHVCAATDPDIYPLEVLRAVLGLGRGARLNMELRERMGAAFDVDADLFPLREPGLLAVSAHLREDDMRRVIAETLRQINKLKDEPVSDAELARAISDIEARHLLDTETAEGQAYALGYWATVYGGGDPAGYIQNIRKVTPDDVQRVAQKYLGEGNYTLAVIRPDGQ